MMRKVQDVEGFDEEEEEEFVEEVEVSPGRHVTYL